MKNVFVVCLLFYVAVFFNSLFQGEVTGFISFFVALGSFIIVCSFIVAALYDEVFEPIAKRFKRIVGWLFITTFITVIFKEQLLAVLDQPAVMYSIIIVSLLATVYECVRIAQFMQKQQIVFTHSITRFLQLGAQIENSALYKAISSLDRYFIGFAVITVLLESSVIYILAVSLLLLLCTQPLRIIVRAFSKKEARITIYCFYISYIVAVIIWTVLDNQLAAIFIASLSMLYIKIIYERIARSLQQSTK